ncbi:MAG: PGPGW domain-containing protein [Geminicoccaceae bacterium]
MKVILWLALGYAFLTLGVLGMFLPILQGFLFLFVGLIILARHAPWAERLLGYLREKSPTLDRAIAKAEAKTHEWRHRAEVKWHEWRYRVEVTWYEWRIRAACRVRLWCAKMADLVRRG